MGIRIRGGRNENGKRTGEPQKLEDRSNRPWVSTGMRVMSKVGKSCGLTTELGWGPMPSMLIETEHKLATTLCTDN